MKLILIMSIFMVGCCTQPTIDSEELCKIAERLTIQEQFKLDPEHGLDWCF